VDRVTSGPDGPADGLSVLVVDDHVLVRAGMRRLLEEDAAIGRVDEASSGEEALDIAATGRHDLVLMDISLPGMNGLEAAERLLRRDSAARIVMVTGRLEAGPIRALLNAGVRGYLTKGSSSEEMSSAIRCVMNGERYLSQDIARLMAMDTLDGGKAVSPFERLTAREQEIVHMLLRGQRNRQISATLHISEKTVSTHRVRAFDKLGIGTTAELVRLAMRFGLWHDD